MKSIATIKIKIPKKEFLTDIIKEYSKCIQYISNKGFNSKTHNRYKLHNLVYYDCRKKFNLPSQFIINAIRVASQTLKSTKTNKGSKPAFKEFMPIDFDKRTFTFSFDNVRISTLNGNRVILVNPRNTSKRCSKCGSLNTIRQSSNFHCLDCSYHLNADLNASFNLKFLGKVLTTKADVNQLHIPNVDSKAIFSGIADDFRDNQYPKSVMPLASA